jgi:hypothetical protein
MAPAFQLLLVVCPLSAYRLFIVIPATSVRDLEDQEDHDVNICIIYVYTHIYTHIRIYTSSNCL